MSCNICLNDLCSGGCCDIDYKTLSGIAYNLRLKIAEIGDNYAERLKEGISCSPKAFDFRSHSIGRTSLSKEAQLIVQYKKLRQLLFTVEKEVKNLYNEVDSCVSSKVICKIKEEAIGILGYNCLNVCRSDVRITTEGLEDWIEANPYCISRESWEKYLYRVCNDMQIEISAVKVRCDLVFDIVRQYRSGATSIGAGNLKDDTDCKIEYQLLAQKLDCGITYDIYKTLHDCGITYDLISQALECGITFSLDRENNCPMIFTVQGGFSLCDSGENQSEQLRNIIKTFSIN